MKLPHIGRLMLTHADFPRQDWETWRREQVDESRDDDGATIDTGYLNVMPCCIHCATWICVGCHDFRRSRATRAVSQYCPKCGGREGFFLAIRHLKPHEPLPKVPFIVPRMTAPSELEKKLWETYKGPGRPLDASLLACPAGDPCPATGCPACCPSYDPCGEKGCQICQGRRRGENMERVKLNAAHERTVISNKAEREFWGLHKFKEAQDSLCCSRCGWGYNDPIHTKELQMHVPEEAALKANAMGLDELEECGWVVRHATLETPDEYCGLPVLAGNEYCPEHQKNADAMAKEEAKSELTYPRVDGDVVVLAPGLFIDPNKDVINWNGENYYKHDVEVPVRKVTDKDRELIAANTKATIARRDRERLKETALHIALETLKNNGAIPGGSNPEFIGESLVKVADKILDWLAPKV
jgi:hypothetical protein